MTNQDTGRFAQRLRKISKLHWASPSKINPHGLTGLISVGLGCALIAHSLTGHLQPFQETEMPMFLLSYCATTFANALAGYRISHIAWKKTQGIFRRCAMVQMILSYYILRFSPYFTHLWQSQNTGENIGQRCLSAADSVVALALVACILSFNEISMDVDYDVSIKFSVLAGSLGLLLLATYPIQLAYGGQEWLECIGHRYPLQSAGMIAYIYIPASVTFSLMLFAATLFQRGILSAPEFGMGASAVVLICLVATVLSQEVHIPDISTQRIYLPCVDPEPYSWEGHVVEALDFSKYARMVLTSLFGIQFPVSDSENKH